MGRPPRQRRGTAPQMRGRYPDYDVLEQAGHWDAKTREVVLGRVQEVPPVRFFGPAEAATAGALCDTLLHQREEPRVPVLEYVDEKLYEGQGDGYRYFDMPPDTEAWRLIVKGLDEEAARRRGAAGFAALPADEQDAIAGDFAEGRLFGGSWALLNVERAFQLALRYCIQAFYSHPWAWNEIGFGGPAYPRGYSRFGSPHLQTAEREPWEGKEEYDEDPVRHVEEPAP
ncbi:MAG TPA: gluconate 2-dehydrogenase subunit 3 family protein [Solirubrobacteraceae bacterium]|nr:gluconate 2-dehydrogenase subunit 3 family protein [Solirubrobacteraceae bacterium]